MTFNKLVRAFQIYRLKVLMHISGQNSNLCFLCVNRISKHFYVQFYRKSNSKFISRATLTNQINISTHHYFDLLKQNIG